MSFSWRVSVVKKSMRVTSLPDHPHPANLASVGSVRQRGWLVAGEDYPRHTVNAGLPAVSSPSGTAGQRLSRRPSLSRRRVPAGSTGATTCRTAPLDDVTSVCDVRGSVRGRDRGKSVRSENTTDTIDACGSPTMLKPTQPTSISSRPSDPAADAELCGRAKSAGGGSQWGRSAATAVANVEREASSLAVMVPLEIDRQPLSFSHSVAGAPPA